MFIFQQYHYFNGLYIGRDCYTIYVFYKCLLQNLSYFQHRSNQNLTRTKNIYRLEYIRIYRYKVWVCIFNFCFFFIVFIFFPIFLALFSCNLVLFSYYFTFLVLVITTIKNDFISFWYYCLSHLGIKSWYCFQSLNARISKNHRAYDKMNFINYKYQNIVFTLLSLRRIYSTKDKRNDKTV